MQDAQLQGVADGALHELLAGLPLLGYFIVFDYFSCSVLTRTVWLEHALIVMAAVESYALENRVFSSLVTLFICLIGCVNPILPRTVSLNSALVRKAPDHGERRTK